MKRDRKILVCMTDDEFLHLEKLASSYSSFGFRVTKSFLVRYSLKRLPSQLPVIVADWSL